MITEKPSYTKPYFLEPMNEEGLSSENIAAALCVRHDVVAAKMRAMDKVGWSDNGWNIMIAPLRTGARGRPKNTYLLNTDAAKVFVARWENAKGDGYMRFLLACEKALLHQMPKMQAAYLDSLEYIEQLESEAGPKVKRIAGPKMVLQATSCTIQPSLFGERPEITLNYRKVPEKDLTPSQKRTAKMHHLSRCSGGMMTEMARLQREETADQLPHCLVKKARRRRA